MTEVSGDQLPAYLSGKQAYFIYICMYTDQYCEAECVLKCGSISPLQWRVFWRALPTGPTYSLSYTGQHVLALEVTVLES